MSLDVAKAFVRRSQSEDFLAMIADEKIGYDKLGHEALAMRGQVDLYLADIDGRLS